MVKLSSRALFLISNQVQEANAIDKIEDNFMKMLCQWYITWCAMDKFVRGRCSFETESTGHFIRSIWVALHFKSFAPGWCDLL